MGEILFILLIPFFCALGIVAFTFSTIGGGGGALLMIPVLNFIVGPAAAAPLINLGNLIGRPSRVLLFWKFINWKIVLYYAPFALLAAFISSYFFSKVNIIYLQLFVALFLIGSFIRFKQKTKKRKFKTAFWHFSLLGIVVSVIGTFVGGMGPVANPFYLNAKITKEAMIATKAMNSFIMGSAQVSGYLLFGLLNTQLLWYGISLGVGATIGNYIGKYYLKKISDAGFKQLVYFVMLFSGIFMLLKLVLD